MNKILFIFLTFIQITKADFYLILTGEGIKEYLDFIIKEELEFPIKYLTKTDLASISELFNKDINQSKKRFKDILKSDVLIKLPSKTPDNQKVILINYAGVEDDRETDEYFPIEDKMIYKLYFIKPRFWRLFEMQKKR